MPELSVRAAGDGDADLISDFINVCTLAHQGVARSWRADALERLHQDGSDPATDSFLVFSGDELAGFAHVWRAGDDEAKAFGRTHPDAVGTGVGSTLLACCEARARALAARLTATSWASDERAPVLFERRGYAPIRHFLKMSIEAAGVDETEPRWPEGIRLRQFVDDGSDDTAVYNAWLDTFSDHFGPLPADQAAFWHERRESRREGVAAWDATLGFVAEDDEGIAGFSFCEESTADEQKVGRVGEIGVRPRRRGEGLGFALLQHSFLELRRRGADEIVLNVDADNVTSALRLYVKAGMRTEPAFTIWELRLE